MEYWEAYESRILDQTYFHLKACIPLTKKHSITGKPVYLLSQPFPPNLQNIITRKP